MGLSYFEKFYKKLNLAQKEAVQAIEGPVMVIAGPGTGKTTVLTLRIANILRETDTPPDAILALTFTDSGVHAIREKLLSIIGPAAYRVRIHTFHSFANELIKTYPDRFSRIIGAEHVEALDQINLMQESIDSLSSEILRPKNNPEYYVSYCLNAIRELKRENVSPEKFKKLVVAQEKEIKNVSDLKHDGGRYAGEIKGVYREKLLRIKKNKELAKVYSAYEKKLSKRRLYDFEDMITEAVGVLSKDRDLLMKIQEEALYILADEHQDANNAQSRLLELVASFHQNPNLFIVGDEKQAIFRFQGASLENFLYFRRLYPSAKIITLSESYRSHKNILGAADELIGFNKARDEFLRQPLISRAKFPARAIVVAEAPDYTAERFFVASEIKKLISQGFSPREIAVLIRENKDAEPIEKALRAEGISVARFADADALSHVRIDAFLKFLEALANPEDERLAAVLFYDFLSLNQQEIFSILEERSKTRKHLAPMLKNSKPFGDFWDKFSRWGKVLRNEPLIEGFGKIAEESGFLKTIVSHENAHELLLLYRALLRAVERFAERDKLATLRDFLEYLSEAREHGVSFSADLSAANGVPVMTAHRAKGLEFDAVFVVRANHGIWGGRHSRSVFDLPILGGAKDHETEDERRLFYVALTRARREVFVSYNLRGEDGRERLPSQFIGEISAARRKHLFVSNKNELEPRRSKPQAFFTDRSYLRALFLERGFSVTHLNNFLSCSWRYFFVDLMRIPESQSPSLLYGSAVHTALKSFFDAYARDESLSITDTVALFEKYLWRTHLSERDFKAYLSAGRRDLRGYLSAWQFPCPIFNEYKIGGVPLVISGKENIMLNGLLDKIEILSGDEVNIVDYKTGQPKSRNELEGKTKGSDGNYKRQLVFYKLLLDDIKKWKMRTGTIDFIKPDERGNYRRESFEIFSEEVRALRELVTDVARRVWSLSFWDKGCGEKDCKWCRLSESL